MTEHRSPDRAEPAAPLRRSSPHDRTAPLHADPLASLHALQGAPVRRVRPSSAPGRADVERYLRYLRGPTAFGA